MFRPHTPTSLATAIALNPIEAYWNALAQMGETMLALFFSPLATINTIASGREIDIPDTFLGRQIVFSDALRPFITQVNGLAAAALHMLIRSRLAPPEGCTVRQLVEILCEDPVKQYELAAHLFSQETALAENGLLE